MELFDEMVEKGVDIDAVSVNTAIAAAEAVGDDARAAELREAIPLAQEEPSFRRRQLEAEAQAVEAPIAHFEAFFSSVEAVRPQDYTLGNAVRLHAATETTH